MKLLLQLVLILVLASCGYKSLHVIAEKSEFNAVVTQSLRIDTGKEILSIVCFSEVSANTLVGISCQNDTGFHLFSGGLKTDKNAKKSFEIEKISRFLFKIKPQLIKSYITLALFNRYQLQEKNVEVKKHNNNTQIVDKHNHLKVELNTL